MYVCIYIYDRWHIKAYLVHSNILCFFSGVLSRRPPAAMVPILQAGTITDRKWSKFLNILKYEILANLLCFIFCKSLTLLFGIFIWSVSILCSFWFSIFSSKFRCWREFGGICFAISAFPSLSLCKPTEWGSVFGFYMGPKEGYHVITKVN